MANIIAGTIWFFIILTWDVFSDYKKWKKGIPVNHKKESIIRIILLSPTYFLLWYYKAEGVHTFWYIISQVIITVGLISSVWWELFDGWYNKKRGYAWRFDGTRDPDDAKTDQLLYGLSDLQQAAVKLTLIAGFLIAYLIT